jgi:hypothetical protein
VGPQGPAGPLGPQGSPGAQGNVGPSPAGPPGPQGPQGIGTGPTGAIGPQGAQGATGASNSTPGPLGESGPTGATGPQGSAGAQGSTGPVGDPYVGDGPVGPQGGSGPFGPAGPSTVLQTSVTSLGVGTSAGPTGEIVATNNVTAFYSDVRLKDNIERIKNIEEILDNINGVYFTQNKFAEQFGYNDYKRQIGVIAQEIAKVLPEAVTVAPFDFDGTSSKSGENYLTVQYLKLIPIIIEGIKLQQAQIDKFKELIL